MQVGSLRWIKKSRNRSRRQERKRSILGIRSNQIGKYGRGREASGRQPYYNTRRCLDALIQGVSYHVGLFCNGKKEMVSQKRYRPEGVSCKCQWTMDSTFDNTVEVKSLYADSLSGNSRDTDGRTWYGSTKPVVDKACI